MLDDVAIVIAESMTQPDEHRSEIARWTRQRRLALWPGADAFASWNGTIEGVPGWHHAASFNHGAVATDRDVLVLMDADVTVNQSALLAAAACARAGGWAMMRHYAQLNPATTDWLLGQAPIFRLQPSLMGDRWCGWVGDSCSWAGLVAIRRSDYMAIRGYDERLSGWAPDDIGFGLTASALIGPPMRIPGAVWHLWHEPSYERDHGWTGAKHDVKNRYLAAADDPEAIRVLVAEKRALG